MGWSICFYYKQLLTLVLAQFFHYFKIVCSFFTISTIAQEVKTQKFIMQIPNTDLVKDFNLKITRFWFKAFMIVSVYLAINCFWIFFLGSPNNLVTFLENFKKLVATYGFDKQKVYFLLNTSKTSPIFLDYCKSHGFQIFDFAEAFENSKKYSIYLLTRSNWGVTMHGHPFCHRHISFYTNGNLEEYYKEHRHQGISKRRSQSGHFFWK